MSEGFAGGWPSTISRETRATSSAFPANSLSRFSRKRTWVVVAHACQAKASGLAVMLLFSTH
jgi:hypothetical protein